jgi:hypothetical protein
VHYSADDLQPVRVAWQSAVAGGVGLGPLTITITEREPRLRKLRVVGRRLRSQARLRCPKPPAEQGGYDRSKQIDQPSSGTPGACQTMITASPGPDPERINLMTIKADIEFAINQISRLQTQLAQAALGIIFATALVSTSRMVVLRSLMELRCHKPSSGIPGDAACDRPRRSKTLRGRMRTPRGLTSRRQRSRRWVTQDRCRKSTRKTSRSLALS